MKSEQDGCFTSYDKTEIYFKHTCSAEKPYYHFILIHGAFEHHGRHDFLEAYLRENLETPFSFTWLDLRGHGKSSGERSYVSCFEDYIKDLQSFLKQRFEILGEQADKTILIGHSMGGLICGLALINDLVQVDAAIFSNPAFHISSKIARWTYPLVKAFAAFIPKFRMPIIFSSHDIGRDPASVEAYEQDPLIPKFITLGLTRELLRATYDIRRSQKTVTKPCLFLLSQADKITTATETAKVVARNFTLRTSTRWYNQLYHELFREPEREEVFNDIIAWLKQGMS